MPKRPIDCSDWTLLVYISSDLSETPLSLLMEKIPTTAIRTTNTPAVPSTLPSTPILNRAIACLPIVFGNQNRLSRVLGGRVSRSGPPVGGSSRVGQRGNPRRGPDRVGDQLRIVEHRDVADAGQREVDGARDQLARPGARDGFEQQAGGGGT